jgi:hypothetical protein
VELVTGEKPDLSNLRIFGCPAYVHIDSSLRTKFGDKAWKGIFVGYAFDSPSWLIYNPATRRVIRSRNVIFDETWRDTLPSPQGPPIPENDIYDDDDCEVVSPPPVHEPSDANIDSDPQETEAPSRTMQLELERTARIAADPRSRSERAQAAKAFALNAEDNDDPEVILLAVSEPVSYNQAMKTPEKPMWKKAVEAEYLSLTRNSTWDLVPYLGTMKVIGSMWKFKLKRDSTGNITKYKARLVARGDQQEPDWNSVFAPTVRYTSLRVILAIACINDWEIEQMDVVSAFLNADVESEIYMEQPQGYVAYGDKGQPLVCHLKKALYGIREAPKAWNELFTSWLIDFGFVQSLVDPGVFTFK